MRKANKIFGCIGITLVIWLVGRFAPALIAELAPDVAMLRMLAFIIMLPIGWVAAKAASKGKYDGCVRVNLYIFAVIEISGLIQVVTSMFVYSSFSTASTYIEVIAYEIAYTILCFVFAKIMKVKSTETFAIAEQSDMPDETDEATPQEPVTTEAETVVMKTPKPAKASKQRYCKYCGGAIDPETKKCGGCGKQFFYVRKTYIVSVIMVIVMLALVWGNIYQFTRYQNDCADYENRISELSNTVEKDKATKRDYVQKIEGYKKQISELRAENRTMENEISFYDRHVVFVNNDGTKKYHKYDCDDFGASSFWAYNTEAAKGEGYKPCPKCCK